MRTPLGLEKRISLEYIEVVLGLVGVDVSGLVGWMLIKPAKGANCQNKQDHVFVKDSSNWSKGITA